MSTIVVQGSLAVDVRTLRDERADIGDLTPYLSVARTTPQGLDVATLAIVLAKHVRFTKAANAIFIRELERGEDAVFDLAELRKGIEATADAAAIITACEQAGCASTLARALAMCFIDKNPKLVEVDEPEDATDDEDDDADEGGAFSLPDRDPSEEAEEER